MTTNDLQFGNYAVCFIDLLGQRRALAGQGLLPDCSDSAVRDEFHAAIKRSIGVIAKLHIREQSFQSGIDTRGVSPLRELLPDHKKQQWDQVTRRRVIRQRWSDGIVASVCLAESELACPAGSVFDVFSLAGSLCLINLAARQPLRGGIEVAWATELYPGEVYGAGIVRAYEIESKIAQWPRIVVGPLAHRYLSDTAESKKPDLHSGANQMMARLCLSLLRASEDGQWEVDYLGQNFRNAVTQSHHEALVDAANAFARDQAAVFRSCGDAKLAERYDALCRYFDQSIAL